MTSIKISLNNIIYFFHINRINFLNNLKNYYHIKLNKKMKIISTINIIIKNKINF